ncbi:MAG: WecB/TagA/CpsF family glycosyltransferase [Patescibacteria group bacterium]
MRHEFLGVRIDDLSGVELETKLESWLTQEGGHTIATPNAEFLLLARKNPAFADLLNRSDLAMADSVSLQYAAAALSDHRLEHRVPGVDLLERLCTLSADRGTRVLFLGGAPSAAESSAQKMRQKFDALDVVALDPGRIRWNESRLEVVDELVDRINVTLPSVVAVALGQHKQEQFIAQVKDKCPSVKIWIGVGGAFEMISGQKRRAPRALSRLGLEWLWRLWIEPRRARRIVNAIIVFPLLIVHEALRRGTFFRSTLKVFLEILRTMITTPSPSLPAGRQGLKRRGTGPYER